jgi:hypothetical protein
VSWLYDQFKAVSVQRGVVEASWEHAGPIEGASHFEALLKEAIQETGYRGQTVSLLLAHQRLAQQMVDVPPVKGTMLAKLMQRHAQQQKVFQGEAAWAFQTTPAPKGTQRVLLHLFPRILLNQLSQASRRHDLHLVSVMPPSVVLQQQLASLPADKGELSLLAAETGNSTTVVIGRHDGEILLARTLPGTWKESADRLALDLNRTVLFASQQYGVNIDNGIWLFGAGAEEKLQAVQSQVQVPVRVSPVEASPFYWATTSLKLRTDSVPNFISAEMQKAPQRRVFAKVVAAGTILAFLASIAGSGYILLQAQQELKNIATLGRQIEQLQTRQQQLQKRNQELAQKRQVTRMVLDEQTPPVPAWFLAYLGETVPSDLVITNCHLKHEGEYWRVQLGGTKQTLETPLSQEDTEKALNTLKTRLASGPFHLVVLKAGAPTKDPPPGTVKTNAVAGAFLKWMPQALSQPAPAAPVPLDNFVIEGLMR